MPHSKEVQSSNTGLLFVEYPLPQPKDMDGFRLIGDSELVIDVNVSMDGCNRLATCPGM